MQRVVFYDQYKNRLLEVEFETETPQKGDVIGVNGDGYRVKTRAWTADFSTLVITVE